MSSQTESPARARYLDAAPATIALWSRRLQWTRVAVDAAVVVLALTVVPSDVPLQRLAPLFAAAAAIRADLAWRAGRGDRQPRWESATAIGIDAVVLGGLLELSGGPSNPFAVIYVVQVVLAAATLGAPWAYGVAALAAACYGVLIAWHLEELAAAHHRLIDFPTHLLTMWLALAIVAELVAHFIREASAAIACSEAALADMRAERARSEHLMSLTTLSAGAAHELSTPLGTIAVASRELELALARVPNSPALADDARLIREQVERCHVILDQMSGRAGGTAADVAEPLDLADVFADLRRRLPREQADRVRTHVAPARVVAPRAGLVQVLLSLVKNAIDATDPTQPVSLEGVADGRNVRLIVRDQGHGMSAEVMDRAGEPFFTTKEPGRGFGLGLFLARMFAERCGGRLTLESGAGTTATLELPRSLETPAR